MTFSTSTHSPRLFIVGGIILTTLPFLLLFGDLDTSVWGISRELFVLQLATTVGAVSGFMAMSLFLWQVALGSRQFSRLLNKDTGWMTHVHKWLGMYGTALILLHPCMEMYAYGENILFLLWPELGSNAAFHITLGRFALMLFLLILVTSAIVRGKLRYRPWKYIHYLSYPMIVLTFFHALDIGSTLLSHPLLLQLWYLLLVGFLLFCVYRIYEASGIGAPRYTVVAKKMYGEKTAVITLQPQSRFVVPAPGQYCYLQARAFGETHPFSVMGYNPQTHELTFGIKAFGPFSQQMVDVSEGDELRLDGPYGVFTREAQSDEPAVYIAGGIGVTPFFGAIERYGTDHTYLLNCNVALENAVYRDELKTYLGPRYFDVLSQDAEENADNVIHGRLNTKMIQECIPQDILQTARFFFCGPEAMYEDIQDMCAQLNIPQSRLYYEAFSF